MVYPRFGPDGARVGRESVVNLAQMAVGTAKNRWTPFLAAWVERWHYEMACPRNGWNDTPLRSGLVEKGL
jgi:hypothetical protein